jgi:ERCC4-type nuclease
VKPLVAPTEPAALKELGLVSLLPERVGCDVLFFVAGKKCGVQRKEANDLLKSTADGRLAKELAQMREANVAVRLVIVEGRVLWTEDGEMLLLRSGRGWLHQQWQGLLWSIQEAGAWVAFSDDVAGTCEMVRWFGEWCGREHRVLATRPGPAGMWGATATGEEWGLHLLQGFPGVGPALARRVVRQFGRVPLVWGVSKEEMMGVAGLGAKKVDAMWRLLEGGH